MKVLVIAAHPDDEILGVGGTLLKHKKEGDEIFICMVTTSYSPEWSEEYRQVKIIEQKEVDKILGVKKRFNLDFPTVKLNTIPHGEFNKKIDEVIDKVKPDIIYTHFEDDLNYDHSIIFKSVLVGTRPPKKTKVICYETPSETEWNNKPFQPNLWIDITEFIDEKIKAFSKYESEVKEYPHPRSKKGVRILANKRGVEVCVEYAEAFMIIKEIK